MEIEKKVQEKLVKGIDYLKSIGCKEIILFGSFADGTYDESSDIDIAVSGLSPKKYCICIATNEHLFSTQ